MRSARIWSAFALLSLIWGSSYLYIRIGDEQITPVALVALRVFFGALAITAIAVARKARFRIPLRALATMVVLASINTTIPFLLISWGEVQVQSGLAAVLNSTTPIFSILIASALLHDEPITLPRIGGIALGFVGVIVLLSRDLGAGAFHWSAVLSQGAVVLAAAFYAASAVSTRRWLSDIPSMTISTYTLWLSATEAILLSLIVSRPPLTAMHPQTWLAVVWLGVLGSAVAYLLYYFLILNWGASRATLVTYVVPAIGLVLGAIFLHEIIDWRILAGSALIIGGVVLASLMPAPAPAAVADHAAS